MEVLAAPQEVYVLSMPTLSNATLVTLGSKHHSYACATSPETTVLGLQKRSKRHRLQFCFELQAVLIIGQNSELNTNELKN